jgi:HemN C-terminal domain
VTSYLEAVESGILPVWRGAHLDADERMRRTLMFSLRCSGVDRLDYRRRYGVDPLEQYAGEFAPLLEHDLLTVDEARIRLTDRGAPFGDGIALRFVSGAVRARVRETNASIIDLKRDPVERYDFSPIDRGPVGAGVDPVRRSSRLAGRRRAPAASASG